MPAERVMVRLALEKTIINAAKRKIGKKAEFRQALDSAVEWLPEIEEHLLAAGLTPSKLRKYRLRPVSNPTIEKLDAVVAKTGLPRSSLIRASLVLFGRLGRKPKPDMTRANEKSAGS